MRLIRRIRNLGDELRPSLGDYRGDRMRIRNNCSGRGVDEQGCFVGNAEKVYDRLSGNKLLYTMKIC